MEVSDQVLAVKLKEGSQLAFKQLFDRYTPRIFRFALSYLKSEVEAEGLVQDVFLKVWERRELIDVEKNLKSYLFKIAVNSIYDLSRKKNYENVYSEFVKNDFCKPSEDTWNEVVYNELVDHLNQIVNKMPEQRKKIFLMSKEEGLSHEEISSRLNISRRTVENQVYRAVATVKDQLKHQNVFSLIFFFLFCM